MSWCGDHFEYGLWSFVHVYVTYLKVGTNVKDSVFSVYVSWYFVLSPPVDADGTDCLYMDADSSPCRRSSRAVSMLWHFVYFHSFFFSFFAKISVGWPVRLCSRFKKIKQITEKVSDER